MKGSLDGRSRALAGLSATLARGRSGEIREALVEAAAVAESEDIEEIVLQAYLFVGFPTVLNTMAVWRELQPGPAAERGVGEPAVWREQGEALCRRVYGPAYERLRHNVQRLHPALDRWMVEEGYGKVLSRTAVDEVTRELCIVALLSAAGHERQLHSHLLGALNVGAEKEMVKEALDIGIARATDAADIPRLRGLWQRTRRSSCSSTSRASG
jgi:4-carboxymuconolactone decarboxylase